MDDAEGYEINRQTQLHTKTLLDTDVFIEILSRTSLKAFHIIRCTSKHLEKLTYNSHVLDLFKGKNNVLHGVIVQQKKVWGSIERKFVSSCGSINFDIGCIPNSCTILATSLNRLILGECDCPDEYPEKFLFICKPTTLDCRTLPFPIYKYIAVKFAMVVMRSNPLHFKIIRLSYAESDDVTNDHDYENFRLELFQSTTWEWRDLGNIRLPYYVHPVSDEAIISKGVVYILLSNYQILQFDAYSEEYVIIFSPSTNINYMSYTSRLIKFEGKLGFFCLNGDRMWGIWVLIRNQWVEVDVISINADAHEWWDYRNNELSFFTGKRIECVVPVNRCHEVFSFCSDFETITMPRRFI
ncbi:unnamed protein product [Lactuca virosa]|uniref:F-box associated beta-propeller type 3 domain-containing protein n=1 Tax=Lactuca virosa TaxID=75947 RepID=A0AAU9PIC3_9ASTR|nr:unnamed protein product [Lactuca virosa]